MSRDASAFAVDDVRATLTLIGEVDEPSLEQLREEVRSGLQPPVQQLVIDLSACQYLEPLLVDLVGEAMGQAAQIGARSVLHGASANVRVILGIAGLLDFGPTGGDVA